MYSRKKIKTHKNYAILGPHHCSDYYAWTGVEVTRACLDQLLIAIRSLVILCNNIRSKTRLIMIMNLIAILWTIYTSLYNGGLSRVSVVTATAQDLLLHTNRYGEWGRWGAAS